MKTDGSVTQQLETLRLRLLDLSGRNRFLNFKFSERSRTQVWIIDELPDQIFEKLEKDKVFTVDPLPHPPKQPEDENTDAFLRLLEAMRDTDEEYKTEIASLDEIDQDSEVFQQIERALRDKVRAAVRSLGNSDYARYLGINPDYDLPTIDAEEGGKPSHWDNKLQTLLYPDDLERKLASLRDGARKSLQEMGLNTLYLAFGMLEWYETDQSDKRLLAPLFLYPVALQRKLQGKQYNYTLESLGDEPEENFSLRERLRRDFGLVLPAFQTEATNGTSTETPESYFSKVVALVSDRPRWKVRRFLTLSLFSFGGIALFQDLNPERWPKDAPIDQHPLIEAVLCGPDEVPTDGCAPDYPVDEPEIANKVPFLITDADASQFSAIADAMDGKNLVIEGPPGTGKSQTITNLIAAALSKGKKVLFVAEKKAALEVVYNRLANAGLENYCLEVHSTNTKKQAFYERLKQRVEQEPLPNVGGELKTKIHECSQLKQQLTQYVTTLNQKFGNSGKTIQELLWAALRAKEAILLPEWRCAIATIATPSTLAVIRDNQAPAMTEADFQRKCQHLQELSQQHQALLQQHGELTNHPWYAVKAHRLSPIDQDDLIANVRIWAKSLQQLQRKSQQITDDLRLEAYTTLASLNQLCYQLQMCPELDASVVPELLPSLQSETDQKAVTQLIDQLRAYRQKRTQLIEFFNNGLKQFPSLSASLQEIEDTAENLESIAAQIQTIKSEFATLFYPNSRRILLNFQSVADSLKHQRSELSSKYRLNGCKSSSVMYQYSQTLRSSNFFSTIFDDEYRRAKDLWEQVQKGSQWSSDKQIARVFEKIADYLESRDNFESSNELRLLCGQFFDGLNTDFNTLISLNSFTRELEDEYQSLENQEQQINSSGIINRLGYFYQGIQTDIERLEKTNNFAQSVRQSQLPQTVQANLLTANAADTVAMLQSAYQDLTQLLEREQTAKQAFLTQGEIDTQEMFGSHRLTNLELGAIAEQLDRPIAASNTLATWINYLQTYQTVVDDGLQPLVEAFTEEELPFENMGTVYTFVFYRSLVRFAYEKYPLLNQFSGVSQAQAREQFQQADVQLLKLYQQQLAFQLSQAYIEPGNSQGTVSEKTEFALIMHEINKQRKQLPPRKLFHRTSIALPQLKPCWMMSPASVAEFIPPGRITFDLVIIDEASQMRPEEALGAIARANQLIVVGDPKQLPPTDFFRSQSEPDIDDDVNEEDIIDDESILDMSLKTFYPARRLKWHYRSRHESLIAFSNQQFYDNDLTIFPSPNSQFAVDYQYIEIEDKAYRSGINVPEVKQVAEAAADFMRQQPQLSLGIVTLNQKQQQLLLDEMDRLFAQNPELEDYRAAREETLEPFFVKNLENVQGDERDVIFISTVYGPEQPGMLVKQQFGPINRQGGHRRLNVLFTRAKEKIVMFSSMKSTDIRPTANSSRGVHVLKDYLDYAQTQRLPTGSSTGRKPDSDFEIAVAERLQHYGYEVVPQVGVAGYYIDLAVVDPQHPSNYLLGIECDGATYHSSKAARDRDRLRQQVLERLGWRLYRIWSTDWFANPTAEMQKLERYIQGLL